MKSSNKASVIILAGQSNMEGWSLKEYVISEYEKLNQGPANVRLAFYKSKQQTLSPFQTIHFGLGVDEKHFGPEIGIAKVLAKKENQKYYLIKYAVGGTSLYNDWISPSSGKKGNCYNEMVKYVISVLRYLIEQKVEFEITHFCFMQGEADASVYEYANEYFDLLKNFIQDIRSDFSMFSPINGIKFVDGGISDSSFWPFYELINQTKKDIATLDENNIFFDTIKEGLTYKNEPSGNPDLAHYDALSMIKLGELFGMKILS